MKMTNRYQKLFSLMPNQYSEGCPVIIEAGALQKDTETGNVIAQIKMRNIGEVPITSCKVLIRAFENNGDEVEGVSEFSYLDLNTGRGHEFGAKVPVILPNRIARSFAVDIKEIVFSDGSVKRLDKNQWKAIPTQQPIEAVLTDAELVQQYKIEVGEAANLFAEQKDGFFLCTCGALNYDTAEICYKCGNSYDNLCRCMDRDYLLQKIDERNIERRIEQEEKEGKKKLYIKIGAAAIAVVIVFGIMGMIHQKYEEMKEQEICASLAGKSYTAIVEDWGERHCDFNNDGTVHDYSYDNSGKNWGDDEYVYEVRKLNDGYVMDFVFPGSENLLFYNGKYDYVITGIQGNQITEFTETDSFAGIDVYKLDTDRAESQTAGKMENDSEDNE